MASTRSALSLEPRRLNLLILLAAASAAALWFITQNALVYTHYDALTYGDYWPRRYGLIPHITGGVVAILSGVMQLWLGLTGRIGRLHRVLGKVYTVAIVVGSTGAFYLALTLTADVFAYAAGLFFLAVAWVVTTGMAILAIRRRNLDQHREWMIRSYVVTFAFVSFRLVEKYLYRWHVAPEGQLDAFMGFACWSIPLLLTEPLLQLRRMRTR